MKTFYINGTILAMEEKNLYAEAVCVENGRITAVGSREEILSFRTEEDEIVDLKGAVMLPGFIDGHSHFVGTANSMTQCELSGCKDFADIVDTMKAFKEKRHISEDAWIVGCNYDHNFLAEERHPDRYVLDKISPTNPVLLIHASSHMGVTNSKGLELQGIDEHTEDRPDGKYGRIPGTRTPDGYMEEKAFLEFQAGLPMTSVEELMKLMGEAQNLYASYGITTVQDGMVGRPLFQLLKAASKMGILKLDIVGYLDIMTAADLIEEEPEYAGIYQDHLKIGGYKIFLDGSPQGKTAWMLEPYEGEREYRGYPIHSDEKLREYIALALDKKQQLLAHCNGDAAAEQYVSQFEEELKKREEQRCFPGGDGTCSAGEKRTAEKNGGYRNDAQLLYCPHLLLGRYPYEKLRTGKRRAYFSGRRCRGLWDEVHFPSGYTGGATGYDADSFLCSKPCVKNRTEHWCR